MQLTLTLSDDLAQRLQSIPDSDKFVREVLQAAIEQYTLAKPVSKWSAIAKRIEQNPIELGDYTMKFKQDMQEVRDHFIFKDSV
jgi:extradiol dioxygenase family protein